MILFNHPYYFIELEEKGTILSFRWKEAHKNMSYPDFQEACSNFAGYAFEHQTKRLLINTQNFRFEVPAEFSEWRENTHKPRFYHLGVEKMAYIMPEAMLDQLQDSPAVGKQFALSNFASETEALNWLNQ